MYKQNVLFISRAALFIPALLALDKLGSTKRILFKIGVVFFSEPKTIEGKRKEIKIQLNMSKCFRRWVCVGIKI